MSSKIIQMEKEKEDADIDLMGIGDWFSIVARNAHPPITKVNPKIEPFFFNRNQISNEELGMKLYEYLLHYREDLSWEDFVDEDNNENNLFLEKTSLRYCDLAQVTLEYFHSKKIGASLRFFQNHFTICPTQKLINGHFLGMAKVGIMLPNPITAKELGYWMKDGLNQSFLRGNYKIPKSSGVAVKYNRRLEIISPAELPEGQEPILPRNRASILNRTALILYLKNGLLGYYQNSFSVVAYQDMLDPYAQWGFLPYGCSDKELGERIHRSLLILDPPSVEESKQFYGCEKYVAESQRVERLFLDEMKSRLGLESDEELFEGLLCCYPIEIQRNYLIAPTRRIGPKDFAILGKRYVVENIYCTASELGASVREGFRRCESAPSKDLPTLINYDENP